MKAGGITDAQAAAGHATHASKTVREVTVTPRAPPLPLARRRAMTTPMSHCAMELVPRVGMVLNLPRPHRILVPPPPTAVDGYYQCATRLHL